MIWSEKPHIEIVNEEKKKTYYKMKFNGLNCLDFKKSYLTNELFPSYLTYQINNEKDNLIIVVKDSGKRLFFQVACALKPIRIHVQDDAPDSIPHL